MAFNFLLLNCWCCLTSVCPCLYEGRAGTHTCTINKNAKENTKCIMALSGGLSGGDPVSPWLNCACAVCVCVCVLSPEGRKSSSRTPGIEASSQRHAVLRGSLFIPLHCLLGDTSSLSSSSAQVAGKWASCFQGTTSGWCTTAEEGLGLTWRCSRMELPLLIIYVCTLFSP